jgi:hypothetical protein
MTSSDHRFFQPDVTYSQAFKTMQPTKPNCLHGARGNGNLLEGPVDITDAFGTVHYQTSEVMPTIANYFAPLNKWIRAMVEIDMTRGDNLAYCSLAYTDEAPSEARTWSNPMGAPGSGRPEKIWIEINSSQPRGGPEIWMWFRNIVVLRNTANSFALLVQPS